MTEPKRATRWGDDEMERRITRLEIQLSQLHDMVRAINQRTRPATPKSLEPDFDQEYRKTEDDLK